MTGSDLPASSQVQAVQAGFAEVRNRNQPSHARLRHVRHAQRHVHHDARFDLRDSRNRLEPRRKCLGGPLDVSKDVGKAVALVIRLLGSVQRSQRAERHDARGDAGSQYQRDRQHLAFDVPQITQHFAVEG